MSDRTSSEALRGYLRMEDVLESIPDLIYVLDRDLRLVHWNRHMEVATGFSHEELHGRHALQFFVEEDRASVAAAIGEALATGCAETEGRLSRKCGAVVPYHWSGVPLREADGAIVGFTGVGRNIAQRKETEDALATERERLAATLRCIGDAVVATDAAGRVVLMNEVAETLAGVPRANVLGRPMTEWLTRFAGVAAVAELARCRDGRPRDIVVSTTPPRVFEMSINPITVGPEAGGLVLLVRDVTDEREGRRRIEEQGRLAAIGQLAAGIAHDFNNILTVVVGVAERLRFEPRLRKAAREKIDLVAQQGRRASHLVRQIMDFSRRSAAVERRPIDLAALVEEVADLLRRTIPEHIVVATDLGSERCVVEADPTQVQQILTNLALNGWDAMPNGGELSIRLSRVTVEPGAAPPMTGMGEGDWVALSVADQGSGIAPEHVPHLFEPFFTTKDPGKGTGLGLAQVYGLVKQIGGFIDVASAIGGGATFTAYLPVVHGRPEDSEADVDQEPLQGQAETILLVEDEESVREVVTWELTGIGYRVLAAANGEEAMALYEQHKGEVALVLLDLLMPGIGGAELYYALRQHDPELAVIVLSGYPQDLGAGSDLEEIVEWLQKPISLGKLTRSVDQALRALRVRRRLARRA